MRKLTAETTTGLVFSTIWLSTTIRLFSIFTIFLLFRWCTTSSTFSWPETTATFVSSIWWSLNGFTIWTGDIRCFAAFFSSYDVKFYKFTIANWTNCFFWIVLNDGRLMNEDVLLVVITIDKSVAAFNIEPFDCTTNFGSYKF